MIGNLKILVELFAYLYCLAELFGKKLKISIHAVVFIILDIFLLTGIDQYGFPEYLFPLSYMGMFLYGLLYYRESIKLTLVNCFISAVILSILQLLLWPPLYWLFFIRYEQIDMNELLINTGCFVIIILCSYKLRLKRLSDFFIKRNKLITIVCISLLCGFGLSFYKMKADGVILKEMYLQMVYFLLIFLFVIYEWQKSRVDAEKRKTQLEMNKLYYDAYDQLIMVIRERQHDMKSHINAILGMIYTTDNYDELTAKQKEYCGYVMERNEKTRLLLSSGNPLIAGFLYSKIQEAEGKGITVDYQIDMQKTASAIPEYELVEITGILMDNAVEALSNVHESINDEAKNENTDKKMHISIKETEEYVELIVANISDYYDEDMTERFFEQGYSSKGKGHGIGLSKLKRMVHSRKGEIMVSNEMNDGRNYLTFTITIPKEKKQKS